MTGNRGMKIAVWSLSCVLVLTLIWAGALLVKNYLWKREVSNYAGRAGRVEAMHLFLQGKLWLYEVGPSDDARFTGRMEGPFEVHNVWYLGSGEVHQYAIQTYVDEFNEQMKRMQADAEKAAKAPDKQRLPRPDANTDLPAKPASPR